MYHFSLYKDLLIEQRKGDRQQGTQNEGQRTEDRTGQRVDRTGRNRTEDRTGDRTRNRPGDGTVDRTG